MKSAIDKKLLFSFDAIKDERVRRTLASFVSAILFYLYFIMRRELSFPFDAGYYWNEADPVFEHGFDLLLFPETFRGYFLPVFYGGIKKLGSSFGDMGAYYLFWFVRAGFYGTFFSVVLPGIFRIKRITGRVWIGITGSLLMIFYFIDDIPFPLTDTASFALFSISVYFGLCWWDSGRRTLGSAGFGLLSGVAMYLAYNIRILNLYGFLLLAVYYLGAIALKMKNSLPEDTKKSFLLRNFGFITGLLAGILIAAAPQMIINHHYRGTFTPRVLYEQIENYEGTQELFELQSGIERYKYDTYIGTDMEYPYPGIAYQDKAGTYLLERVEGEFSISKLVYMFLHYPVDMMGVYGRNLFSLMTITTGDYIRYFYDNHSVRFMLVVAMWIMTALVVFVSWPKLFGTFLRNFYIVALVIPAVLEVSDAPEIRFFYPVYYCMFSVLCYAGDLGKTWNFVKEHFFYVFLGSAFVTVLWAGVYGNVLMENGAGLPALIGDRRAVFSENVLYERDTELNFGVDGNGYVFIGNVEDGAHEHNTVYQVSYSSVSEPAEFYPVLASYDMSEVHGITMQYNPDTKRWEGCIAPEQDMDVSQFLLMYNVKSDCVIYDFKVSSIKDEV